MKRQKNESFIENSIRIHKNKYDYLKVVYVNSRTPVIITCKIHGNFFQAPYKHLIGRGCQSCGGSKKLNFTEFIEKSKKIHGDCYDYSNVDYVNNSTKIEILCKLHGCFLQRPADHFIGQGCPKCVGKHKTTEEFVKKSNLIHQNKYDYSKTIYQSSKKKVRISCPNHGEFRQIPDGHINGKKGCPRCSSIISKQEELFLNCLKIPNTKENRQIKILRKKVDGYDKKTNTIYEFLGDYWHGNPSIFKCNEMNTHCNKTFGCLYEETMERFKLLVKQGYYVKYIWEKDWETWNKHQNSRIPIKEFYPM